MKLTHDLVLGSKSPRRAQLLSDLGFNFRVLVTDADENAPVDLDGAGTARWISEQKARALQPHLKFNELGITSDTEVWLNDRRYGKAKDYDEAYEMLQSLSGKTHQVITGLSLITPDNITTYHTTVEVEFKELPHWAIDHYIKQYQPFDKAGAYGIQEWIGSAFISSIQGEYNAVVGLPTSTLFEALEKFKA